MSGKTKITFTLDDADLDVLPGDLPAAKQNAGDVDRSKVEQGVQAPDQATCARRSARRSSCSRRCTTLEDLIQLLDDKDYVAAARASDRAVLAGARVLREPEGRDPRRHPGARLPRRRDHDQASSRRSSSTSSGATASSASFRDGAEQRPVDARSRRSACRAASRSTATRSAQKVREREERRQGARRSAGPQRYLAPAMSPRPRILVVDDEEAILETMTFTFEDDYEVLTSSSARDALRAARARRPGRGRDLRPAHARDDRRRVPGARVRAAPDHGAHHPDRLRGHGRDRSARSTTATSTPTSRSRGSPTS